MIGFNFLHCSRSGTSLKVSYTGLQRTVLTAGMRYCVVCLLLRSGFVALPDKPGSRFGDRPESRDLVRDPSV